MSTLVDLLPSIQRAIAAWKADHHSSLRVRPIVVSIDDDVVGINGDEQYEKRWFGLLGKSQPNTRMVDARNRVKRCAFPGVVYLRISPDPHVGAQAATGWEVSQTSRHEDLVESLRTTKAAGAQVARLREMLDGTMPPNSCGLVRS
jgi:hypothetical protein